MITAVDGGAKEMPSSVDDNAAVGIAAIPSVWIEAVDDDVLPGGAVAPRLKALHGCRPVIPAKESESKEPPDVSVEKGAPWRLEPPFIVVPHNHVFL